MSDRPLLISSAKSGASVQEKRIRYWYVFAVSIGLFVVLYGAADIWSRLQNLSVGLPARLAFVPAITLIHPGSSPVLATSTPVVDSLTPARLLIPSLGVDAPVEQVGKKADGSMGTPQKFGEVAWYALGPYPGQPGSAVIAGHVNNALTTAGVFEHLSQIPLGATITVLDASGRSIKFIVVTRTEYPTAEAPLQEIFSTQGPSQLVLITCAGDWIADAHSFNERLVVVASLARI
jgi:sortase (surface protein transpeptidase)